MLSLYGTYTVPGVNHVKLYRDDENPHKFYMLPERPSVARDEQGKPLFTFIMYARDLELLAPEDRKKAGGYLSLSTQVSVSAEDMKKIAEHLHQMLEGERSAGYKFLGQAVSRAEPELSYPPVFTQGKVEFTTFSKELVPFWYSTKPSLVGANIASFSQEMDWTGAELFRQSVAKGLVPAIINYELSFLARIPAVSIRIKGNRNAFYQELKNKLVTTEYRRGPFSRRVKTWSTNTLTEFRSTFHSLTITIDSGTFGDKPGDDATKKLEELAFQVLEKNILPSFFETAFPVKEGDDKSKLWLDENKTVAGEIDITITSRTVVEMRANPNAQLSEVLTPKEVESNTVYVDLGQGMFQELDVAINANVNFAADPVYALKVFIDYDAQDDQRGVRVKKAKEYLFKSGDQIYRFRQMMAKDAQGTAKDRYKYWSEIIYKDTGETIRIPTEGALETDEKQLVISYRRLGFVKVNIAMTTLPENIRSVHVKMRYPGSTGSSAEQSFDLTREKPTATFFTYTGQTGIPGPYRYQISYKLTDGQLIHAPEEEGHAETLTVADPFEQTVTTRFLAQADFGTVQKIIVDASYRDPENDFRTEYHAELGANGDTSAWSFGLRDPKKREIEYRVLIVYRNGSREEQPPKKRQVGETIPVGAAAIAALEVTIVPEVDWTKYKLVLLYLEYADQANNVRAEHHLTFRKDNGRAEQTWKVLLRDDRQRSYRYRLRYLGVSTNDNRETNWVMTAEPILVVE